MKLNPYLLAKLVVKKQVSFRFLMLEKFKNLVLKTILEET